MGPNSEALQNPRSTGGSTLGGTAKHREVQVGQHFAVLQNTKKYRWVNTLRYCKIPKSTGGPTRCGTAQHRVGWINISRPMHTSPQSIQRYRWSKINGHAYVTAKYTEVQTITIHGQCIRHRKAYRGTIGQQSIAHAHVIARYTEVQVSQQSMAHAYVTARHTEAQVVNNPRPMHTSSQSIQRYRWVNNPRPTHTSLQGIERYRWVNNPRPMPQGIQVDQQFIAIAQKYR